MTVNIVVECPDLIASVRVGVLNSLKLLIDQNVCNVRFIKTIDIKKRDIVWADIVICVRGCEKPTLNIIKAAKECGRFIIYFLDDDLLHIPDNVSCSEYFGSDDIKSNIKHILKLSDVLWYVNPLIGEIYSQYTDARLVQTKICVQIDEIPEREYDETCNILYAGSVDHTELLNTYIAPAAYRIMDKYKEKVSFTFIGAIPDIDKRKYPSVQCKNFFKNYDEYEAFVQKENYNIGMAVVNTSQFYKCKYYNKFIEYTKYGIMGIYTNSQPYTSIVIDGLNGLLTDNSVEAWFETLDRAVSDRILVEKCAYNAKQLLLEEFKPENVTADLVKKIPELVNFSSPKIKGKDVKLGNPFITWLFERIGYYYGKHKYVAFFVIPLKAIKVISIRVYKGCETLVKELFFRDL